MIRIDAEQLKGFIERIERLEDERKAIGGDVRDVYAEAKGKGFSVKQMRKLIGLRKMDAADRDEQDAILTRYMHALGMPTAAEVRVTTVVEPPSDDLVDKRALRAIEMLNNRASIRDVVAATGMGHGTVQRLRKTLENVVPFGVPQDRGTPPHDPATGEITPSEPGPARAAAPAVSAPRAAPAGSDTPSPAGGAPHPADLPPIADALPVAPSVPAGEPDAETDRGSDARPTPEGPAARVTPPSPDPDADWEKRDSAATFFEGHRIAGGKEPRGEVDTAATLEVIARCKPDEIGQHTARMIDTIAERPVSPEVASIAIQTARLVDEGRIAEAAAVVAVTRAATGDDLTPPDFLRVGTEANKAARAGR